jgi:hypothetical protein
LIFFYRVFVLNSLTFDSEVFLHEHVVFVSENYLISEVFLHEQVVFVSE